MHKKEKQIWTEMVMGRNGLGRNGYGPKWSWAEMVMAEMTRNQSNASLFK